MRKVLLNDLTSDMKLARPVYRNDDDACLLNIGVTGLGKYKKTLEALGVTSLYIEDPISEGIDIPQPVSDRVISATRKALGEAFQSVKGKAADGSSGILDAKAVVSASRIILDEILACPQLMYSLSDIRSVGDDTLTHSVNVAIYGLLIGKKLGLPQKALRELSEGALLHDIGKVKLDKDILLKPGKLTPGEYHHVQEHTTIGYKLLQSLDYLSATSKYVSLAHHERLDGSGYPGARQEKDIHLYARITAVADIYDALTSDRCYRKSFLPRHALNELYMEASHGLDRQLVDLLAEHLAIFPNGIYVELSDHRFGIVKEQNPCDAYRPVVRILYNSRGIPVSPQEIVLSEEPGISILREYADLPFSH